MPYRIPAETADRIWPDKKEYDEYLQYLKKRHKGSYLAFRLGGESSLRLNKQLEFSLSWRVEHPDPDVKIILIEVPDRKYTGSKNIEKNGIAYVPESLWEELVAYAEKMNRGREEPLIDRSGRQVRNDCEYAGKEMAEDYEYQAYEELRPHDGRRYFARTMYRVHGVDKQVVKYLGGWKSDSIFAEYSHVLSEKEIQNELSRKGVPEDERLANPREAELNQLYGV